MCWTTEEEEKQKQLNWENELLRRYANGLPLTTTDKREARRIIRERKKQERPQ